MAAGPLFARYEALSLRERAFVSLAILGLLVVSWDSLLMDPLRLKRSALEAELANASAFGVTPQSGDASDPRQVSIRRAGELQTQLQGLDAQLANTASGFVSSKRMIEVLHDMLDVYPGKKAKFVKNFMQGAGSIQAAVESYVKEVKAKTFPDREHSFV